VEDLFTVDRMVAELQQLYEELLTDR